MALCYYYVQGGLRNTALENVSHIEVTQEPGMRMFTAILRRQNLVTRLGVRKLWG